MKKRIISLFLLMVTLASKGALAQTATPQTVIRSAQELTLTLRRMAPGMTQFELDSMENSILQLIDQANYPVPVPPAGPFCKVLGEGVYQSRNREYRISIDSSIVYASDHPSMIFQMLAQLKRDGACVADPRAYCTLKGAGTYANRSRDYRLATADGVVFASDHLSMITNFASSMRQSDACGATAVDQCRLMGAGSYKNRSWQYRVAVGTEVVYATDHYSMVSNFIAELKKANLCY